MTDNKPEAAKDESQSVQVTAESLLSPNTEKAINEIISNGNDQVATRPPLAAPAEQQQTTNSNDNFENLQKAVQILGKAKQLDEIKKYDEALKLYRTGVDMLLEELIVRQGTDQSRSYLREKCNDFMNRIDQLKLIIQIEKAEKASAENKENQAQIASANS